MPWNDSSSNKQVSMAYKMMINKRCKTPQLKTATEHKHIAWHLNPDRFVINNH